MRVNTINAINQTKYLRKNDLERNRTLRNTKSSSVTVNQPAFKGFNGKIVGGLLGAGLAGIGLLATVATGGLAAAALLAVTETGGAVIGGAVGDAITGKDDDDDDDKKR